MRKLETQRGDLLTQGAWELCLGKDLSFFAVKLSGQSCFELTEKNMLPVSRGSSELYKKDDVRVDSAPCYPWRGFACQSLTLHRALGSISTVGEKKGKAIP